MSETETTTTTTKIEMTDDTPLAPPSIPNDNTNDTHISEPPLKRMKVDAPAVPHYNSHNIYSRPNTSTLPNNISTSLPTILPPISPLNNESNNSNEILSIASIGVVAPLPKPAEEWPLCAYCSGGGDLSRCSSCRQSYYCNRECQVAHWEVHCVICQPGPPQPPPMNNYNNAPIKRPIITPKVYRQPMQYATPIRYNGNRNKSNRRTNSYDIGVDGNKEQYYCEECDRYFKNGQALGGHRSRVHSTRRNGNNNMVSPYQTASQKRRRTRPSRARHSPSGTGRYVCPHCSREFKTGNALGGHISGAHTKKSKRNMNRGYDMNMGMPHQRYARPRHPNL